MEAQAGPNVADFELPKGQHQPVRPTWTCDTDGEEWPCVPARERILTTWTPIPRALTMAGYFSQACEDMGSARANDLHRRFLGWVRVAS
jgi:hypothetical protein